MPESDPVTVVGFDVGLKRIGIAAGQSLTGTAQGLTTVAVNQRVPDWTSITTLVNEWQPQLFVVGRPRTADGSATSLTRFIDLFCRQLTKRYALPVESVDERLTSNEADHQIRKGVPAGKSAKMRRVQRRDSVAAEIILKSWFAQLD